MKGQFILNFVNIYFYAIDFHLEGGFKGDTRREEKESLTKKTLALGVICIKTEEHTAEQSRIPCKMHAVNFWW